LALTANGNLQRLLASYYDAPVTVEVEYCTMRSSIPTKTPPITTMADSGVVAIGRTTTTTHNKNNNSTNVVSLSTWDRCVHLRVYNQTVCIATSVIDIYSRQGHELVASGQVGLGQLFRYWDILPTFTLHNASVLHSTSSSSSSNVRTAATNNGNDPANVGAVGGGGSFWREYTLSSAAMTCHIHETFAPGLWLLQPPSPPP
jgi:hypothetical protein